MQDEFEQLAASVRLADVLDVGVITLLLYCGLQWFRQRASRSLAIGLIAGVGLFLCARWLEMYLTTMLFHAGVMAVVLALVVVFQQDIRRAFDRLAASGYPRRSPSVRQEEHTARMIDTLVESVVRMSDQHTGALLVFEGREPTDPHVRGGVGVNGIVSSPLLHSIFHTQSPGHDGAVLIDDDRIERLGVHLPLSGNLSLIGSAGTRHAAALGLSERCDALVIVVSEERGTISVARHGRLDQVETAELKTVLERFYRERFRSARTSPPWYRRVTNDVVLKLAALSTACVLWLLFAYRVETVQRTFVVPIEYRNLPDTWTVDPPRPNRVELTLSGSERVFDMLDATELAVSLDLARVRAERSYFLRPEENLKGLPDQLTVSQARPAEVMVVARRKRQQE